MGRTKFAEKIKKESRISSRWREDILHKTNIKAQELVRDEKLAEGDKDKLLNIMYDFLHEGVDTGIMGVSRRRRPEAEAVYQLLLLDRNEDEAFAIFFICALLFLRHKEVFPFSPAEARSALETGQPEKVFEFYRPLFDEAPDYIVWDLKRYADRAGRGKPRLPSYTEFLFLSVVNAFLRSKNGRQSALLLKCLYRLVFGKKIHLPDYKYLIELADKVLAARLEGAIPGANNSPPTGE